MTTLEYGASPAEYEQLDAVAAYRYRPDVVIPFTYSTNLRVEDGRIEAVPSVLSEMAMCAACDLVNYGAPEARIVIAGEHSYGPRHPSTSALMRRMAPAFEVDPDQVTDLSDSTVPMENTSRQIVRLADHLRDQPAEKTPLVIAMDYHLPRIRRHAQAWDFPIVTVSVNALMNHQASPDAPLRAEQYPQLGILDKLARREKMVRLISLFDPKGSRLLDWLTAYVTGPQLHDVVETDGQGFQAIVSRTRLREREAERELAFAKN